MVSKSKKQLLERKAAMLANTLTHKFLDAKNAYIAPSDDEVMTLAKDFKKEKQDDMKATYDYPAPKTPSDDETMSLEKQESKDRLDDIKDTVYRDGVGKAQFNGVSPEDTGLDPVMSLSKVERDEYNKDMDKTFGTSDEFSQDESQFDDWIGELIEPEDFVSILGENSQHPARLEEKHDVDRSRLDTHSDSVMLRKLFDIEPEDHLSTTHGEEEKEYSYEPEPGMGSEAYEHEMDEDEPEDRIPQTESKQKRHVDKLDEADENEIEDNDEEEFSKDDKDLDKVEDEDFEDEDEDTDEEDNEDEDFEDDDKEDEDEDENVDENPEASDVYQRGSYDADVIDPNDEGYDTNDEDEEDEDDEDNEDKEDEVKLTKDLVNDIVDAAYDKFEDLGLVVLDPNDLKNLSGKIAEALDKNYNVITDQELQGYAESVVRHTLSSMQQIQESKLSKAVKKLGSQIKDTKKHSKDIEESKKRKLRDKKHAEEMEEARRRKFKRAEDLKKMEEIKNKKDSKDTKVDKESLDIRRFKDLVLRQLDGEMEPAKVGTPTKKATKESVQMPVNPKANVIKDVNFIGNKFKTENEVKSQKLEITDKTIKLMLDNEI